MSDGQVEVALNRRQAEMFDHALQRRVLRPVIDDDHLEIGIMKREQRLHAFDDRHFLVEGRGQHAMAGACSA
jgi:hypothetical protein